MSEESATTQTPDHTDVQKEETLLATEGNAETQTPEEDGARQETASAEEGQKTGEDSPVLTPEEDKPEEKQSAPKEEETVPEEYEYKLPEGMVLEGEAKEEADKLFHDLKLSQGNAQKLIDAYTRNMQRAAATGAMQLMEQRKAWRNEVRNDPSFQRDLPYAQKGMNAFLAGDPEAKTFFRNSWMADHPAFFRGFARLGRLIAEDSGFSGSGAQGTMGGTDEERFPVK